LERVQLLRNRMEIYMTDVHSSIADCGDIHLKLLRLHSGEELHRKCVEKMLGYFPVPVPDDEEGAAWWFLKTAVPIIKKTFSDRFRSPLGVTCPACFFQGSGRAVEHHAFNTHPLLMSQLFPERV
jgi:hypothetical protein